MKTIKINDRNVITVAPTAKHRVVTTDAEIDAAIAASKATPSLAAVAAGYDPATDKVRVSFDNGSDIGFPRAQLQGLEHAMVEQLEKIEIEGPGTGLYWPALDVAHYIPGLLEGVFGNRAWMAALGKKGGSVKSSAKAAAARENGKNGGRKPAIALVLPAPKTRHVYAKKVAKGGRKKSKR